MEYNCLLGGKPELGAGARWLSNRLQCGFACAIDRSWVQIPFAPLFYLSIIQFNHTGYNHPTYEQRELQKTESRLF